MVRLTHKIRTNAAPIAKACFGNLLPDLNLHTPMMRALEKLAAGMGRGNSIVTDPVQAVSVDVAVDAANTFCK